MCTCVTKYPPLSFLFLSLSLLFWRRLRPQARLSFFDQKTIHSSRGIKNPVFQINSPPRLRQIGVTHAHDNNNRKTDASVSSRWFRAIFFFALNTRALRFIRTHKTHARKRDPLCSIRLSFSPQISQNTSDPFLIMSSDEKNDTTRATPANSAALVANDVNVDEMVSHLTERVHEISTRDDDDERNKEGDEDEDDAKKVDLQSDNRIPRRTRKRKRRISRRKRNRKKTLAIQNARSLSVGSRRTKSTRNESLGFLRTNTRKR